MAEVLISENPDEVFENHDKPIIKIVNQENFDEILEASTKMRNEIRGQDIGGLG